MITVLKFGGTSMGSVDALKNVKQIIESHQGQLVVVVSAMSGVTNQLIEIAEFATEKAVDKIDNSLLQLYERHIKVAYELLRPHLRETFADSVKELLYDNVKAAASWLATSPDVTSIYAERMKKHIIATGEMVSSGLLRLYLEGADIVFAPEFIKTYRHDGVDILDSALTESLIQTTFKDIKSSIVVTQGFIASDRNGDYDTNLGRGGSDYTAALIAAALNADNLEIWTDVDGVMTADPRIDPNATLIKEMTYEQAQAIADNGAKVIYPPTVAPVAEKHIPLWIKNTFNPGCDGTLIC